PTEASYLPTDASVVENARRPVAVHRMSDLNRRRSDSSEPFMSLIRPAQWAGDGARRRIESAGSQSVMSPGTLSTTALLRASMERTDPVVAGQLPASGDTEGSSWRRAVGGRSSSTWDESVPTTGARSRRDEAKVVRLAHGNRGRAASRRGDPRRWRGARAGRS